MWILPEDSKDIFMYNKELLENWYDLAFAGTLFAQSTEQCGQNANTIKRKGSLVLQSCALCHFVMHPAATPIVYHAPLWQRQKALLPGSFTGKACTDMVFKNW